MMTGDETEMTSAVLGAPEPDPSVPPEETSGVQRTEPDAPEARRALVEQWAGRIRKAKTHHEPAFKRMRKDMKFVRGLQWENQKDQDDPRYVANLTLRHLTNKVAALYAKNPKAEAQRRKRIDFEMWDGNPDSLMQAQQMVQMAMQSGDPMAMEAPEVSMSLELMQDVQRGMEYRNQIDRIGKTLEIVYEHQLSQQQPRFKKQMKQLIRRAATTGVGYVKLGYYRVDEQSPDHEGRIADVRQQLSVIEQRMADMQDNELQTDEAEAEELREMLESMMQEQSVFVREGLDVDFPSATSIIPDPLCRQLDGFLGARWVAQEYLLTPDQVQRHYDIDVKSAFRSYDVPSEESVEGARPDPDQDSPGADEDQDSKKNGRVCVWEVYDRVTGLVYHVADGYPDFLKEPHAPYCKLEQFFPFFVLTLNEVEDEGSLFPPSDVQLIRPMQEEHNVSRQRMREHRDAARPKHAAPRGKLSEKDKQLLQYGDPHSVVELDGMQSGENIQQILQAVPVAPLDPNLYETGPVFDDILKAAGTQEANMGGASGATATETSVAEASRQTAMGSNTDDLDDFLTDIARNAGYILLTEMAADTVAEIAGPGAVWPEVTAEEVAKDLWLTVRAGSSGKPNKSQEIQNFERLAPILMQVPGISPQWLARQAIERLDDRIEMEEAFYEGIQSITAMNHQTQPDMGEPGNTQNDQAGAGGGGASGVPNAPPDNDANQGPNNAAAGPPPDDGRPQAQLYGM